MLTMKPSYLYNVNSFTGVFKLRQAPGDVYASENWVTVGFDDGLLPDRHQVITRTNHDLLLGDPW